MNFEIVHRDPRQTSRWSINRTLFTDRSSFYSDPVKIHRLLVLKGRANARVVYLCRRRSVVEALGGVEVVVRMRVRGRRVPPRRWRGSLGRQAGHRGARSYHRLELARAGELLERRRVALREVQLGLDHGSGGRQGPRGLGSVSAPRLSSVRVHVVVDVLLHLRLGGEPPPAVGHRAAERPVTLVRPCVLVENRLLPKVLAALGALVRLLAGMDTQVLVEDGPLTEEARAVHAAVRFLISVDAQVLR